MSYEDISTPGVNWSSWTDDEIALINRLAEQYCFTGCPIKWREEGCTAEACDFRKLWDEKLGYNDGLYDKKYDIPGEAGEVDHLPLVEK